jgi:hypothetical protein
VIEICLVAFGSLLLLGSIGAFLLYIPLLNIAAVVAILLGMALAFLLGVWVGGTRILQKPSDGAYALLLDKLEGLYTDAPPDPRLDIHDPSAPISTKIDARKGAKVIKEIDELKAVRLGVSVLQ